MPPDPTYAPDRPLRIFVASTELDLKEHRKAVADVIDKYGDSATRMETFGARPGLSLPECRKLAAGADGLVVIVANRYGWVPTPEEGGDGEKSITWHEVEAAEAAGIAIFGFLSEAHANDDARLARFRAVLNKRIAGKFTTPADLATNVAIVLGKWPRTRDFASALRRIDLAENRPETSAIRVAPFEHELIVCAALEDKTLTTPELDLLIEGEHLHRAKAVLATQKRKSEERLFSLRSKLSATETEARTVSEITEQLTREVPPSRPNQPQPPPENGPSAFQDPATKQRALEYYGKSLEIYDKERLAHEASVVDLERRKATLPEERSRLKEVKQRVSSLSSDLVELEQTVAEQLRLLEKEIASARDKDIFDALQRMSDAGGEAISKKTDLTWGVIQLCATRLSFSFLQRYFADNIATATWSNYFKNDVTDRIESAIEAEYLRIGRDCLRLIQSVREGLQKGQAIFERMKTALDVVLDPQWSGFPSAASAQLEIHVPEIVSYDTLIEPDAIAAVTEKMKADKLELEKISVAADAFLNDSAPLKKIVQNARAEANLIHLELMANTAEAMAHLGRCRIVCDIIRLAMENQRFGVETRQFLKCLGIEAEHRFQGPVEMLLGYCATTEFSLQPARQLLCDHAIKTFETRAGDLEERRKALIERAAAFDGALKDIAKQEQRQVARFKSNLAFYVVATGFPVANVICASLAKTLVMAYRGAMDSNYQDYRDLRQWGRNKALLGCAVSVLVPALGGAAISVWTGYEGWVVPVALGLCASYMTSVGQWISVFLALGQDKPGETRDV